MKDIDLWFEDECHFQQHGSRCTMWIHSENKDPILLHAPTRRKVGVFGAVCARDGHLATSMKDTFNAVTFKSFLEHLLQFRQPGQKMVVILDNARWHHAKLLKPWLWENRHILQLDFLPPYSPELNNIERVWKLTRRICTHNRYFSNLEEIVKILIEQFNLWNIPNKTLHTLCAII